MRRISAVLAAVLLGVLSLPALAAETDFSYSGPLDPETGLPAYSDRGEERDVTMVLLNDSMYYDRERLCFVYPLGAGIAEVYANVADGRRIHTWQSVLQQVANAADLRYDLSVDAAN